MGHKNYNGLYVKINETSVYLKRNDTVILKISNISTLVDDERTVTHGVYTITINKDIVLIKRKLCREFFGFWSTPNTPKEYVLTEFKENTNLGHIEFVVKLLMGVFICFMVIISIAYVQEVYRQKARDDKRIFDKAMTVLDNMNMKLHNHIHDLPMSDDGRGANGMVGDTGHVGENGISGETPADDKRTNTLTGMKVFSRTDHLESENGKFKVGLTTDCNLLLEHEFYKLAWNLPFNCESLLFTGREMVPIPIEGKVSPVIGEYNEVYLKLSDNGELSYVNKKTNEVERVLIESILK